MSRFYVERQDWQRFPKVLNMFKDDGFKKTVMRYVQEDRLLEAEGERDHIKAVYDETDHDNSVLCDRIQTLEDENKRLRVLVQTLYGDSADMQQIICNSGEVWGYGKYYEECLACARNLMSELGIKVAE